MTQSSRTARQQSTDDAVTARTARSPVQAMMADQRESTAAQLRQVGAMHGSPGAVAQRQQAGGMVQHTGQSHAQGGAAAMQLKAADGHGVAQLGLLDKLKDALGMGKDAVRRVKAKKAKLTGDIEDSAMGVYHGGGIDSRYSRLDAPTEDDHYDDLLDEESADRERMAQHPVLETGRMVLSGTAGLAIGAGKDALNAVAPMAGSAVGKVAGMGKDKLDKMAKDKIGEDTNPYKVLRDRDEE